MTLKVLTIGLAVVLVYAQAASAFKETATSNEDGFQQGARRLVEIFAGKMAMDSMTVVLKDIRLPSVRDTSKDIVKGSMTHQKTINEIGLSPR